MGRMRGVGAATFWVLLAATSAQAQTFFLRMSTIPREGVGPGYTLRVGVIEITNEQYAAFLNNAQLDAGATRRGSNMTFQADGQVVTPDGAVMFKPFGVAGVGSRIIYLPSEPVGSRYTLEAGFGSHPVTNVSWLGAVKFCNWLTIDQGIGAAQLAYSEGVNVADWHPATITAAGWQVRGLSDSERQALVDDYAGFRLPMDRLGHATGWIGAQSNEFYEWYKLAAFDLSAPDVMRSGPAGEIIAPDHWFYGTGRDTMNGLDANYVSSGDPFEFGGTTPAGYFDGLNFGTIDTNNPFGLYDLSGNAQEWGQDQALSVSGRSLRGGSWKTTIPELSASYRAAADQTYLADDVGFRVVQVLSPFPAPTGDSNGDRNVNLADFAQLSACFGGPGASVDFDGVETHHVSVGPGFAFEPQRVVIELGDSVEWDWNGGVHNVASGEGGAHDGNFRSGEPTGDTDFTFQVAFDRAFVEAHPNSGLRYPYYCEPHVHFGMDGSLGIVLAPCWVFDFDRDDDVDLKDAAVFTRIFSVP